MSDHIVVILQGLMDWHKSHWLKVRHHAKAQSTKRKGRYKQRMELLNAHAQISTEGAPA